MRLLFGLNRVRWYVRLPAKGSLFALTVLAVCFPYPSRLARHVQHWRNPNALIEPEAEALEPLVEELRPLMDENLPPQKALQTVRDFVYKKIKYSWDWDTWGTADYLPTVTEAIDTGREDCDGRAVVAASLLARLGYKAEIVTDFLHVWVKTDRGETMHPGGKKAVIATERGLELRPGAWRQIPRATAYGVAVFPLGRELIVLGVFWLLLVRRHGGVGCSLTALGLLLGGLLMLRAGSENHRQPILWMQAVAVTGAVASLGALLVWAKYNARSAESPVDRASESHPPGVDRV